MKHQKTHQTNLTASWDPIDAPLDHLLLGMGTLSTLDPLGPPGPAHQPPQIPKQLSIGLLRSP